ncbi:MAG: DUF433 domain-containing protein [Elusimicrobiota bacterium]
MSLNRYISINPNICGGDPCFKGHRIPVYIVLQLLGVGISPQDIRTLHFPQLSLKSIQAASLYAAQVLQTGRTYPIARA